jgi:hypothetical protein
MAAPWFEFGAAFVSQGVSRDGESVSRSEGMDFDLHQNRVLSGTMAALVELSDLVIESPHGLHSNAYKCSAKARRMICEVIGRPQTGQATSLGSSLIAYSCTRWRT